MAYSKLHSSLINSSLWTEADHVRILFITLLALCDKDGCVYGSRPGLERAACIDWDEENDRDPWNVLMQPDPHSSDKMRAPEHEGRRIEEMPGGFRLLNFDYYRGLRNDDDRREQNRMAQEKHRQKVQSGKPSSAAISQSKPASAKISRSKPLKAQSESDAESISDSESDLKRLIHDAREKFSDKDGRLVEIAVIETNINRNGKETEPIRSLNYFIPEIEKLCSVALKDETINARLQSRRKMAGLV